MSGLPEIPIDRLPEAAALGPDDIIVVHQPYGRNNRRLPRRVTPATIAGALEAPSAELAIVPPVEADEAVFRQDSTGVFVRSRIGLFVAKWLGGLTGEVAQPLAGALRDTVSVKRFGVLAAGADESALLQSALDSGEKHLLLPAGSYIGKELKPANTQILQGAGMGATVINFPSLIGIKQKDTGSRGTGSTLILRDFTLKGPWRTNQTIGDHTTEALAVRGYDRVIIERVEVRESRYMGIRVIDCGEVIIRDCRVEESCKDAIHCLGCEDVLIEGCTVRHGGDDSIVCLTETGMRRAGSWRIIGNTVEDANGIKMLGANRGVIMGNTTRRTKAYSCYVGGSDLTYGPNDPVDVIVANNVFQDNLNKNLHTVGDLDTGIFVSAPAPVVVPGSVAPGTFDHATDAWVKPDAYFDESYDASDPRGGLFRVKIVNNLVTKTLPPVATYSLWGHGQMFSITGFVNPAIASHAYQTGTALRLHNGAHYDLEISGNRFEGWKDGILWSTGSAWAGKRWRVTGNVFRRVKTSGFAISSSTPFLTDKVLANVDIAFERNVFDLDPYHEHSLRTASGGWSNTTEVEPCAISMAYLRGVLIAGNQFANLYRPVTLQGGTDASYYEWGPGNLYVGTFDGKGVGVIQHGASSLARIVDSDPTSNEYGFALSSRQASEATAQPSSGYFLRGQRIANSLAAASTAPAWVSVGTGASAWSSGSSYTTGAIRVNTSGDVYRVLTAGGGTSTTMPTHASGDQTLADGYRWRAYAGHGGYVSGGTWASAQTYAVGVRRTASAANLGGVYEVVTAGPGTTANEPSHAAGTVTGADGYVWRFLSGLAVSMKAEASVAA